MLLWSDLKIMMNRIFILPLLGKLPDHFGVIYPLFFDSCKN